MKNVKLFIALCIGVIPISYSSNDSILLETTNQVVLSYCLAKEDPTRIFAVDSKTGELNNEEKITVDLTNATETIKSIIIFTDANLKKALLAHTPIIDTNSDGEISENEAKNVKELFLNRKNIYDLSEIKYFTALTKLECNNNQLTTLDISKNTALDRLSCIQNQLTTLDISKNTKLRSLNCIQNQLTTLDISKNIALKWLTCGYNQLTALDISKNTELTHLACNYNQITTLDISKNMLLKWLVCSYNQLSTLDTSKNTELEFLNCPYNQLTTLDTSKNRALEFLNCQNNKLNTLDICKNIVLTRLECDNNQLHSLNMKNGNNAAFTGVSLKNNPSLTCITVDNPTGSYVNKWQKDATTSYTNDCSTP
ncbi:leucine-rich repeat domain-containing protein [Aquimarina sp. AU58]|uniref:leucine-rich repeat domain-containing protein n=1 Tax=Aquimarina sp. AU58 TaxID=1874112 RepID=UPI000D65D208|nr:hypothetical protein [Aquimarina sp. AU58]